MKRGLLDLNKQITHSQWLTNSAPHLKTVLPTYQWKPQLHQQYLQNPTEMKFGESPDKRKVPCRWPACLRRQPPGVTFRNNDIYIVDDEEYEEPKERHPKVQYKLKVCKNPAAQNMPHEKEYDDNNYKYIDETAV